MKSQKAKVGSWRYRAFGWLVGGLPLSIRLHLLFLLKIRRLGNFKHPLGFNEKIQHRKLYDKNPLYTVLADKLSSKNFVKSKTPWVVVPEVLWEGGCAEDLDTAQLPVDYVIKANHGSGMNLFVKNGEHFSLDFLKTTFQNWKNHNQSRVLGELAYGAIEPRFFVEEFLNFGSDVPTDFKCFVFSGKVELIQVDIGRYSKHYRNIMTPDWVDTGIKYSHDRHPSPPKPLNLQDIISAAEALSPPDIKFLRIDFYSDNKRVYFGEITIYPGAGFERFERYEDDIFFGSFWRL